MAKSVEKSAKTVQEAIALALEDLQTDESRVDIDVLDEGNKGIFGFIGNKMAKSPSRFSRSSGFGWSSRL